MDARIQLYIRAKGHPAHTGVEIKTEHFEGNRSEIHDAIHQWIDEQLDFLEIREGDGDNDEPTDS